MGFDMRRMIRRSRKAGASPGTLVHLGDRKVERVTITFMSYHPSHFEEKRVESVEECLPFRDGGVTWVNVDGLHRIQLIEALGSHLDLHPLVLEDILNTGQRPKTEDYGDYVFIVLRMFDSGEERDEIDEEQVSLVLGRNYLLTFQERQGDVFEPVRERIRTGKGRIRNRGADYLAYAIVDALVDRCFVVLERIGDDIESLSEELIAHPTPEVLGRLHSQKRSTIFLRKSVWPLREMIGQLGRGESPPVWREHARLSPRRLRSHHPGHRHR